MMKAWKNSAWLAGIAASVALLGASCVDDPVDPPATDPAQLAPPPAGQGFQAETPEIEVAPGQEVQNCYFFKVSELAEAGGLDPTQPVNVSRIQIAQRDGSHHMNVFRVRTIAGLDPEQSRVYEGLDGAGECFRGPNWADWPLVANSQQDGQLDWKFPEGVANVMAPDEWLMLQTHYVNATTQKTPEAGKVRVNMWTIAAAEVEHEMGTLFATKQSIRVCQSNPTPKFEGSCQMNSPSPVRVIGANGHFHSRGTKFEMYAWDGQSSSTPAAADRFYESKQWNDPPMLHSPSLDVAVPSQGGVWYTCDFQWRAPTPAVGCSGLDAYDTKQYGTAEDQLDCCYTFGGVVEQNEHCNIFVYYYPKQDDVNCF